MAASVMSQPLPLVANVALMTAQPSRGQAQDHQGMRVAVAAIRRPLVTVQKTPHLCKYVAKHFRRQHAGVRVVARAVIAGKQRDLANAFVPKHVAARMLEYRL